MCLQCYYKSTRKERPSRESLKNDIRKLPFLQIGKKYGVSDNAIRKWCIQYNLPTLKREIKKLSNQQWNKI